MELTGSDFTSFVCAESSADMFDYVTSPAASSPDLSSFTNPPSFSIDDIVFCDDDRVAASLASLEVAPLDTEATSYAFSDSWSIVFSSNDQIAESPLTTWADGFMALEYQAEACVPPSDLFRAESGPSVNLDLSSERETFFPGSICRGGSVFQPIPDVLPIGGSSDLNTEDLLAFLELIKASEISPDFNELEAQHFGAVPTNGNGNASICPSPSSDGESNPSSQSPTFSTPASPSPTDPPSPTLASSQPAVRSPEPRVVVLDEEKAGPNPSRQAPKTYNFVFDLKTFGEVYGCKCSKKTKKKNRHWKSCPSNPNRPKIPCPYCPTSKNKTFKGGSAMGNLQKHVRTFHPGSIVPCRPSKRRLA